MDVVGLRIVVRMGLALLAQKSLNRDLVMVPNALAQIIEQLEHRQRLLGGPVLGEDERQAVLTATGLVPGTNHAGRAPKS